MIELCKWEPSDSGVKCGVCGAWRPQMVRRVCRLGSPGRIKSDLPREGTPVKKRREVAVRHSLFKLAWRYLVAQIRERLVARAGPLPQRVIDQRLAICKACPQYDEARNRCKLCGCCSGPSQKKWLNKLALASEECPDRPPRWGRYEAGLREWARRVLKTN